jgi:hypothetical protein
MKYKPLDCLAFGPDWKKSSIVLLDILMIFQPLFNPLLLPDKNSTQFACYGNESIAVIFNYF